MIFNPCNKCIVRPCCSEECDASVHRKSIIKTAKDTVILVGKLALASVPMIVVVILVGFRAR